jgi:AraC-like DNA-binding protein
VDALGDVLDGVRARSASFCRVALFPPWALRIADRAPVALATAVRGEAWIVPDDEPPLRMRPGAVALIKGPNPYTVADDPSTPARIVVGAGNTLHGLDGQALPDDALSNSGEPHRATVVASGTYQVSGEVGRRLLDVLPRVLVVPATNPAPEADSDEAPGQPTPTRTSPSMPGAGLQLLADEVGADAPAQQVMLDRLLDVALIETLRVWFASPAANAPGWYAAHADPVIGPALQLLHNDPAHNWTLDEVARKVGASRATVARRFSTVVGEPPMTYLANWRVTLAADLLRSTNLTIEAIAHQVGYANGFALSVAFQRLRGIRPSAHRATPQGRTIATEPRSHDRALAVRASTPWRGP